MRLELENGTIHEDPDFTTLETALRSFGTPGNEFAVLLRDDMTYMQTQGDAETGFVLEFQEGSLDEHFQASEKEVSIEDIIEAFKDYSVGNRNWHDRFSWEKENLSTGCFSSVLLALSLGPLLATFA